MLKEKSSTVQAATKPATSRRKFLTGATAAAAGTAITGFPMISVAQSPVVDRKSTRLNSSHMSESRMPSSA